MRKSAILTILMILMLILGTGTFTAFAEDAPPVINLISPPIVSKIVYGINARVIVRAATSGNVRTMVIYLDNVEKFRVNAPSVSYILDCSMLPVGPHTIRITADNGKTSEKTIALEAVYPVEWDAHKIIS